MAQFSSRVEVSGDPTLLGDMNMGMPGMNMNMNMNMGMNMGMPGMSAHVSDNGQHVNMSVGMPGMGVSSNVSDSNANMAIKMNDQSMHMNMQTPQMHVNVQQPQMHVSMQTPQVQVQMPQVQIQHPQVQVEMPVTPMPHVHMQMQQPPQVQVQMPMPQVQMQMQMPPQPQPQMQVQMNMPPMPQMQMQMPQQMVAPQPVFGVDFVIRVSEPHMVGEPPEQRTEYYFTLSTNMADWGIYPAHRVSKRYNEVKEFHDRMTSKFGSRFPAFPEKTFFGRFKTDIVNERLDKFQKMMEVVCSDPQMRVHQYVKDFFFATPKPAVVHRPVTIHTVASVHNQPHHQHHVHIAPPTHHHPHPHHATVHVHHQTTHQTHYKPMKQKKQAAINQSWKFENGFIVSQMNGLVLDIKGGSRDAGAELCTWHRKNTDNANQKWRYENGYFVSQLSGLVLDIKGGSNAPGAKLCLWQRKFGAEAENQKWKLSKAGYIISKVKTNGGGKLVLDIAGENREPGAEVVVWTKK
jgi:hypothetical protein